MQRCESRDVSVPVEGVHLRDVGVYTLTERLGKGGFSEVRLAVHRGTGQQYACKIVQQEAKDGAWKQTLCLEIACMKRIRHPNIVNIEDITITSRYVYLFLELSESGTLFDRIKQLELATGKQGIPNDETASYTAQIVCGLSCVHGCGVAHRDVKPDNILLNKEGRIKLTDFGLCRLHTRSVRTAEPLEQDSAAVGTLQYLAPECVDRQPHDAFKADLWSLGVVIYVMLTGKFLFHAPSQSALADLIRQGASGVKGLESLDPSAADLIRATVRVRPNERATLPDVWTHPWLDAAVRDQAEVLANGGQLATVVALEGRHGAGAAAAGPLFPGAGGRVSPYEPTPVAGASKKNLTARVQARGLDVHGAAFNGADAAQQQQQPQYQQPHTQVRGAPKGGGGLFPPGHGRPPLPSVPPVHANR